MANTLARIVVAPSPGSPINPQVWVCNPDGTVIAYDSTTAFVSPVSINVPAQPVTQCFYVYVADVLGNGKGRFSISQAILSGSAPTATIQSTLAGSVVCAGDDFMLSAITTAANPVYNWSGPNGFTSSQPSLSFNNVTAMQSGTYFLTVTDQDDCVLLTANKNITVVDFTLSASSNPANGELCEGGAFILSASANAAGATYSWIAPGGATISTQPVVTVTNAMPDQTGTYTVVVTVNGCSKSASQGITVHPLPMTAITPTPAGATICEGESFTLCASPDAPGNTFAWSGPMGFSSSQRCITFSNASPGRSGNYTVIVTDGNGCSKSASQPVTVHPLPLASITPTPADATICEGESFTLCAGPNVSGNTFAWNGPLGFSSSERCITFANAAPNRSGNYTVIVRNENGCSKSASQPVTVYRLPTAAILPMPSEGRVCEGSAFSLTAETDADDPAYSWTDPNDDFISTQPSIFFSEALEGHAGRYSLTVTDGNGCSQSASQNVEVISFTAEAQSNPANGIVCQGDGFTIEAITNADNPSYSWSGPGGFTSNEKTIRFENADLTLSGAYYVTITDVNGCSETASKPITVRALPAAFITATPVDATVCEGETFILCASTNISNPTFTWSGPNGFSSTSQCITINNASPARSGNYMVTVTDTSGCMQSAIQGVMVNPLPPVTFITVDPASNTVCKGSTFTLSATPYDSTLFYSWEGPRGFISNEPSVTIENATAEDAGLYMLTVSNAMDCGHHNISERIDVVSFSVEAISTPAGGEVCEGGQFSISAFPFGAMGPSYSWTGPRGYISNQPVISFDEIADTLSGLYSVTVTDQFGCTDTASSLIEVHPSPNVTIDISTVPPIICEGDSFSICALPDSSGKIIIWTGPNGIPSTGDCIIFTEAEPTMSGYYSVTVTDNYGCYQSTGLSITVNPKPSVFIEPDSPNGIVCLGAPFTLCASSEPGGADYAWNTPDGLSSSDQCLAFTTSTQSQEGLYTVTATDSLGCTNSTGFEVDIAELPELTATVTGDQVIAGASGGTEPYTFTISGGVYGDGIEFPGTKDSIPIGEYTIFAIDANGCMEDTIVSVITSVIDPAKEWGVTIAPNPSSGLFHLAIGDIQALPLQISVFDKTGRLLRTEELRTGRRELDLSDSPPGLYLLRLSNGEKTGMMKVVVAR